MNDQKCSVLPVLWRAIIPYQLFQRADMHLYINL